jgi:predicted transcriptional regulator of viral defense system
MGKKIHLDKIFELFEKSPVADFDSIKRIVKKGGGKGGYAKQIIKNLINQRRIKRLSKGFYTIHDNIQLSVFCFKPSYFGLQDAMSFHNIWDQETIPVIITHLKVRQGIRKILGKNVLISRINKKYFFGFDYFYDNGYYFPYSDIEKTFIDMIYFKQNIGRDALKEFKKRINLKKLNLYLKKYSKQINNKVKISLKSDNS